MAEHRKLMRHGRVAESDHPKASVFIAACLAWMEEYADTPHSGIGMDGATPRQVFEANLNPNQKPAPDAATLALLLAEHAQRKVHECEVRLDKRRYIPVNNVGWEILHDCNERDILIAYNPNDYETAAALDLEGHFLAELQLKEHVRFAPYDLHTQSQIADSMSQRRHLEKNTREKLQSISRVARQNGAQTPLEAMTSRLRLPANTDLTDVVTQRDARLSLKDNNQQPERPPTPAEAARMFLEKQKYA
jgi:hypothetical protein